MDIQADFSFISAFRQCLGRAQVGDLEVIGNRFGTDLLGWHRFRVGASGSRVDGLIGKSGKKIIVRPARNDTTGLATEDTNEEDQS